MNPIFQNPKFHDVERILLSHSLPVDDLANVELVNFFGCGEEENPKGVIGLEIFGSDGLLRSLAVESEVQGEGCGTSLLSALEQHSKSVGVENLYLLTETAEEYFKNKGFEAIDRECAPEPIKQTTQFSSLCPSSATLMRKVM
jgi:amino-acid N-acetyltransferase